MGDKLESKINNLNEDEKPALEHQISDARILIARLERLSADSYWAHQASGLRGALLRALVACEDRHVKSVDQDIEMAQASQLNRLMDRSFKILVHAAREMGRRSITFDH